MTASIRDAFVSRFGDEGFLVEVDCAQLEICALAEITGDEQLIKELNAKVDIHTSNAAKWLGKPENLVTKAERKSAKVMTFQLQYGAQASKIAETLCIPVAFAEKFIKEFYSHYKGVFAFHEELRKQRDVHTKSLNKQVEPSKERLYRHCKLTGRLYAHLPHEGTTNGRWYYSLTELKNYNIQGFATGDIVPILGNMLSDRVAEANNHNYDIRIVGTVHDSFVFDCKAHYFCFLLKLIEDTFVAFPDEFFKLFGVHLAVKYDYDVKYGSNWNGKTMESLTSDEVRTIIEDYL